MDISGVSIPAVPTAQPQPPQNVELQSAVRESVETESSNNNDSNSTNNQESGSNNSNVGGNVDERA